MFTGIITDVGRLAAIQQQGDRRLTLSTGYDVTTIDIGASIACSGVCLTVVDKGADAGQSWFAVDVSGETLARTSLGTWQVGQPINLERALRVGDELGGHIVTGHIDDIGSVRSVNAEQGSLRVMIAASRRLAGNIATKGSITVDGVSLTINEVEDEADAVLFGLNIIPHTQACTTLGGLYPETAVNLEIDILARYIARMHKVMT